MPSSDKLLHHRSPSVRYLSLSFYVAHFFSFPQSMIYPSYLFIFFAILPPAERLLISYLALDLVSILVSGVSYPFPPPPHTNTPLPPLWICFSAFTRHDLYRVLVLSWPGFAGCLFTTIPPSCNIHKHLLDLVIGLASLCCLVLSFSWVGVMLALFLHHEFVYRLTCLGLVSNILLICFACIHALVCFCCRCSPVVSSSGPSLSILDIRVSRAACYEQQHR